MVEVSIGICFFIYTFLAIVGCLLFGEMVTAVNANIILNINREHDVDPKRWESFILRILFMIVLGCHIPFIFFSGKEGLLIIIDEIDRKSISKTLDERIMVLKNIDRQEIARNTHLPSIAGNVRVSEEKLDQSVDGTMKDARATNQTAKNSSHQSNLRYSLQPANFKKSTVDNRDSKAVRQQSIFNRITVIRETQTLRNKTALVSNFNAGSTVNDTMEAAKEPAQNGLAYKDMSSFYYFTATIIYFLLTVAGSCLIPSVDEIFEFIGVICVNCMSFIFPASFYLSATTRYRSSRESVL